MLMFFLSLSEFTVAGGTFIGAFQMRAYTVRNLDNEPFIAVLVREQYGFIIRSKVL